MEEEQDPVQLALSEHGGGGRRLPERQAWPSDYGQELGLYYECPGQLYVGFWQETGCVLVFETITLAALWRIDCGQLSRKTIQGPLQWPTRVEQWRWRLDMYAPQNTS